MFQLQSNGRVKKYLNAAILNSKQFEHTSLWPQMYGSSVFPFLLCEAKSAKADVSQYGVEYQLTFSTREALLAQKNLALGPEGKDGDELSFQPLVWCVTYRGSECSVLAARLKRRHGHDYVLGYGMVSYFTVISYEQPKLTETAGHDYTLDWKIVRPG